MRLTETSTAFWLLAILLGTTTIFWPALSGPFILDDFLHFPKMAENGSVDTLRKAYQLAFGSSLGSGRPISHLSLLINDNTWPTDPWSFKYTNLMLHLLNGILVFIFSRALISLYKSNGESLKIPEANNPALLIMAIWLLHPIQLSPMMLTIQRMTLLMGTFSLLALITYLKGRWLSQQRPFKGYAVMSLGLVIFVTLGILSKEPAVMVVCYIIAIEATLFASIKLKQPCKWRYWYSLFILLPLLLIAAYFAYDFPRMEELFIKREFNMLERILTESRILMDYLKIILIPSLSATGPYHDDYQISRGLLDPITTLLSIIAIVGLLIFAFSQRTRRPIIAFGILWFFLGHTLESTILPLELYFEHRNYLPMLGVIIGVVLLADDSPRKLRKFAHIALILFIGLEAAVSTASAKTWGNKALIANIWAHEHPASIRAQTDAIRYWLDEQNIAKVQTHIDTAIANNPNHAGIRLYQFLIDHCGNTNQAKIGGKLSTLREITPSAKFDHLSISSIRFIVEGIKTGQCRVSNQEGLEIINLYLSNPRFRKVDTTRGILYQEKSHIYLHQGDLDNTIKMLDYAYKAVPNYNFALNQAYLLMTAGLYDEALSYIEIARSTKAFSTGSRLWQQEHISEIEDAIISLKNKKPTTE